MSESENAQDTAGEEKKDTGSSDIESRLTALKDELQGLRAENKDLKDRYKNIDPDEFFATKDALKQKERESAKSEEELKAIIEKQLREETEAEINKWKEKAETLGNENHRLTVVDATMSKIGPRFNDDVQEIIKDLVATAVGRDEEGLFIKGADGKPRHKPSEPTKRMTVEDFAEELASSRPSLAKSDWAGGSRTGGEKSSGTHTTTSTKIPDNIKGDYNKLLQFFKDNPNFKLAANLTGNGKGQNKANAD